MNPFMVWSKTNQRIFVTDPNVSGLGTAGEKEAESEDARWL